MKRTTIFGGLVLWALAAGAEARDWGFDKDTVYEWNPGGDTVWLVNNGTDTLQFDSLFADDIDTSNWLDAAFSYHALGPPLSQHHQYNYYVTQNIFRSLKMAGDKIPPGQSVLLRQFNVSTPCATAKASGDDSWTGDTLKVRLRFKSTALEMDTLTLMGNWCQTSSIMLPPDHLQPAVPVLDRDALGRKLVPSRNLPVLIKPSK